MKGGSAMLVAAFTIGCGGGQTRLDSVFSSDWRDDGGVAVRRLHAKLASFPVRRNAPVAVGVVENAPGGGLPAPSHMLVGAPLAEGGAYWSYSHPIDGRPQIAGSVVVAAGGGELFALDALTGRPLWVRQSGGALRGAGDDGRTTVVSLGGIGDTGSIVLAIAHDGSVLRQLETPFGGSSGSPRQLRFSALARAIRDRVRHLERRRECTAVFRRASEPGFHARRSALFRRARALSFRAQERSDVEPPPTRWIRSLSSPRRMAQAPRSIRTTSWRRITRSRSASTPKRGPSPG